MLSKQDVFAKQGVFLKQDVLSKQDVFLKQDNIVEAMCVLEAMFVLLSSAFVNVQVCIFDFSLSQLRSILKRSKFQICVRHLYSLHYKFVISFLLETVYMEPRTI